MFKLIGKGLLMAASWCLNHPDVVEKAVKVVMQKEKKDE